MPSSPLESGFCVHVQRQRVERRAAQGKARTIGTYQCLWWGSPIAKLAGQMAECGGPGDNTDEIGDAQDRRIAAGVYPLAVHAGPRYRTFTYARSEETRAKPRPALLVHSTDEREAILIHPSSGYLWSIGCLNPCSGIEHADSHIDYRDSRRRVIAMIDALVAYLGPRMPRTRGTRIPDAHIVIEGEPL